MVTAAFTSREEVGGRGIRRRAEQEIVVESGKGVVKGTGRNRRGRELHRKGRSRRTGREPRGSGAP